MNTQRPGLGSTFRVTPRPRVGMYVRSARTGDMEIVEPRDTWSGPEPRPPRRHGPLLLLLAVGTLAFLAGGGRG